MRPVTHITLHKKAVHELHVGVIACAQIFFERYHALRLLLLLRLHPPVSAGVRIQIKDNDKGLLQFVHDFVGESPDFALKPNSRYRAETLNVRHAFPIQEREPWQGHFVWTRTLLGVRERIKLTRVAVGIVARNDDHWTRLGNESEVSQPDV